MLESHCKPEQEMQVAKLWARVFVSEPQKGFHKSSISSPRHHLVCEKVFLQVLQGRLFPSAISYPLSRDFEPLYKWNSPAALCFGHYIGRFSERKTEVHRQCLQWRDQGAVVWQGKVRAACSACLLPDWRDRTAARSRANSGLILRCRAGTCNPKSLLPPILLLGEEATDSPSDARGLPACCHELESAGKWE